MKIRIATRKSPLALAQTRWVAARLREVEPSLEVEEVQLVTQGDKILDKPLASIGGKGLFISEVEAALVEGRADLAVHSVKDVPEALADGMEILCMPPREDPRDVLVSAGGGPLESLAEGAAVGTSSLRRAVQLHAARPDLRFRVLRGNVGTRLRKLADGECDAAVLAYAGIKRLDLTVSLTPLDPERSLPAVGQGALAIEGAAGRDDLRELLSTLEDEATRLAVESERAFLAALQGSCTTPLAAHATIGSDTITVEGMVGAVDGSGLVRDRHTGTLGDDDDRVDAARAAGRALAETLRRQGAGEMVAAAQQCEDPYAVGPYAV